MKNDEMTHGRRGALRLVAGLGAAAATALVAACQAGVPEKAAAKPAAAPAAGPPAAVRRNPATYRLQPMTAQAPPVYRKAPPVREEPFYELPGLGHSVVLTFDDGPEPTYTPQVLDLLAAHDVRAMFFVCGEMVSYFPDLVRRAADEGHLIGNHTWTHPELPTLSQAKIKDEMGRTSEIIEKTTGAPPAWFRAPYGSWNAYTFELGSEMGMEPLAWYVDTLDWSEPGTGKIVRAVLGGLGPGRVILSHDGGGVRKQTVAALRQYLPQLAEHGYATALPHP
ncbi:polysaccharide deacetylase family protein [Streptomyces sp. NBC_01497]|uniref:polysaccharide deacetylase family protein n=1 Tax=Streptomyces sp. NBC_01497 TaxID=2903885 RepID=UPI002E2F896B|nr:polysaccharide deacetylase family protein [Streptomyces sp. NBC_01497]